MLKHCSPSSVDLTRRSRRNLLSIVDNINDNDEPSQQEEELDLCEDVISLQSFSTTGSSDGQKDFSISLSTSSSSASTSTSGQFRRRNMVVLPRTRIVRRPLEPPPPPLSKVGEPKMPIKVYAKCLRSDIEYKTLSVGNQTTCKELIWTLLSKYRMRHRDPKLFHLTMDIHIKRTGIPLKRTLSLDDDSRPAELKSCHPWGECKFTLQMRKGGLVRIHDSVLMAESKYKCLLISDQTTAREVIRLLFHCYGLERLERVDRYCLFEVHQSGNERPLGHEELPVQVQSLWSSPSQSRLELRVADLLQTAADDLGYAVQARPARIIEDDEEEEEEDDAAIRDVSTALDTSYSSGESTASSEFSALRFRDSPMSASSRSNASTDSGLLKSSPESMPLQRRQYQQNRRPVVNQYSSTLSHKRHHQYTTASISSGLSEVTLTRHYSLHSLLEALPAASVDTGDMDKHASLSSLSSDSRYSDYDGYFYI